MFFLMYIYIFIYIMYIHIYICSCFETFATLPLFAGSVPILTDGSLIKHFADQVCHPKAFVFVDFSLLYKSRFQIFVFFTPTGGNDPI